MSREASSTVRAVEPYTVLAAGYDLVMAHVDYEEWATYAHELIQRYQPDGDRIVELGCGTGSLALALQPRGPYEYLATDRSKAMLKVARVKADEHGLPIEFSAADFEDFSVQREPDIVLLLYDGLNYLLEERDVERLFVRVARLLPERGIFIVDQSTPANSTNNEEYFRDEGGSGEFTYVRRSRYDPETRHHTTQFDMMIRGTTYREEHVQRAYTRKEIGRIVASTGFEVAGCFAGMSHRPATDRAERIHWVLRKQDE